MPSIFSKCAECIYFHHNNAKLCCEAFPEGIPKEIFFEKDTNKECNNGIKFKNET